MAPRRPNVASAVVDLAGLGAAAALGAVAAPVWAFAVLFVLHGLCWWRLRRAALARLSDPVPAIVGALGVLVAAWAGAYGLALVLFSAFR